MNIQCRKSDGISIIQVRPQTLSSTPILAINAAARSKPTKIFESYLIIRH